MLVMLRHADRIKIGCATGGLNALCAADREHVWKGAAYYPFTDMIRVAGSMSLQCETVCECYDVPGYAIDDMNQYGGFTGVQTVQAAAALNEAKEELSVYVINADAKEPQELALDLRAFEGWQLEAHTEMFSADPGRGNSWETPDAVIPRRNTGTRMEKGVVTALLQPESWNVLRFSRRRQD